MKQIVPYLLFLLQLDNTVEMRLMHLLIYSKMKGESPRLHIIFWRGEIEIFFLFFVCVWEYSLDWLDKTSCN